MPGVIRVAPQDCAVGAGTPHAVADDVGLGGGGDQAAALVDDGLAEATGGHPGERSGDRDASSAEGGAARNVLRRARRQVDAAVRAAPLGSGSVDVAPAIRAREQGIEHDLFVLLSPAWPSVAGSISGNSRGDRRPGRRSLRSGRDRTGEPQPAGTSPGASPTPPDRRHVRPARLAPNLLQRRAPYQWPDCYSYAPYQWPVRGTGTRLGLVRVLEWLDSLCEPSTAQ